MTVPSPEKSDLKKSDQDDSAVASTSTDALPAYASGSTSTDSPTPLPPGKPTNFLSISRSDGSIKGSYIIDPRIKPPQADETGDAQQNLFLHASNGGIDVDVFVVGDRDVKRRVDLFVRSKNGSITARVHADAARPPISLKVTDANGPITLHLPRSFRGPITILTRNGSVRFSKPLSAQLTQLGEAQNTRRCFAGDFPVAGDFPDGEEAAWAGDELDVEASNGDVKLLYDDERKSASDAGGKGSFFGRLLH